MLKHLGLHPDGPPLAPAAVLSIVEYPEERLGPAERVEPFTIVAPQGAAMEDNLVGAPVVPGQGPGWIGAWGTGYMERALWRGSEDVMGPRVCRSPFCQGWDKRDSSVETEQFCKTRGKKSLKTINFL